MKLDKTPVSLVLLVCIVIVPLITSSHHLALVYAQRDITAHKVHNTPDNFLVQLALSLILPAWVTLLNVLHVQPVTTAQLAA